MMVEVVIEVPLLAAGTLGEATEAAGVAARDLVLQCSLSGIVLESRFL
jgi:hypothetical protein